MKPLAAAMAAPNSGVIQPWHAEAARSRAAPMFNAAVPGKDP
jgi:hypothetical protein